MLKGSDEEIGSRGAGWLPRAVSAGFFATVLATFALIIANWFALAVGTSDGSAPFLLRWLWALANNAVTRQVQTALPLALIVHFIAGIGWAVVYAALAEPRLRGPGWRRGLVFGLAPWLLSLVVFLPLVGAGWLGLGIGAGPLPAIGNLILHLIYGVLLGEFYLPAADRSLAERGEETSPFETLALSRANQSMAYGIVGGLVLGGAIGYFLGLLLLPSLGALPSIVYGAFVGSALGAWAGSMLGLAPQE